MKSGETAYTSKGYMVSIPRNNETNLTSSTSHTIDLTELAPGDYEIHVDIEREGEWLDRWNANTLRRKITLYNAVLPVNVEVTTFAAENLHDVASIASFGAPLTQLFLMV